MKTCSKCGLDHPIAAYPKKGGRVCYMCRRLAHIEYLKTPRGLEAHKKAQKKWYAANKTKATRQGAIRKWKEANKDRIGAYRRRLYKTSLIVRLKSKARLKALRTKKPEHFKQYETQRQRDHKAVVETLKQDACVDCGKTYAPCTMDFDHVRGEKRIAVANLTGHHSRETVISEIEKCDLVCANCHRVRTWERRRAKITPTYLLERRHWFNSLKSNPCTDCGYIFHPSAMDFDHVRGKKLVGIAQMLGWRMKRVLTELAKCELVCANCHRVRTLRMRQ